MPIQISPRKAALVMAWIAAGFSLAHIAGKLAEACLGRSFGLYFFDLDQENTLPRFFSAALLLLCSGLMAVIAMGSKGGPCRVRLGWIGLALIFLGLAVTKDTGIHEDLAARLRSGLNLADFQFYAWGYGSLMVVFCAAYARFFIELPRKTSLLMAAGIVGLMLGEFGLDLWEEYLEEFISHQSFAYIALSTVEEMVELAGLIVLVYALMRHISLRHNGLLLRLGQPQDD